MRARENERKGKVRCVRRRPVACVCVFLSVWTVAQKKIKPIHIYIHVYKYIHIHIFTYVYSVVVCYSVYCNVLQCVLYRVADVLQ